MDGETDMKHRARCGSGWLAAVGLMASVAGTAQAQDGRKRDAGSIDGELSITGVLASDRTDHNDEDSASGVILRGGVGYERDYKASSLRLEYDTAVYLYEADERADRWSNRGAVTYTARLAPDVTLTGRGAYASNVGTLEFRSTDQAELLGRLAFSPGDHRLRAWGGWRWRQYDDAVESGGEGPFAGIDYRYRLGRDHYLSSELRYEEIDSDDPRRGYHRTVAELLYQYPLGKRTDVRLGAEARWWEYDGRLAPNGERRKDRAIIPELELRHEFEQGVLLRGQVRYDFRDSNDPEFTADETRATLTGGVRF
jgi:hypothetical protein